MSRNREEESHDAQNNPRQLRSTPVESGPSSAGQSGDTQGLDDLGESAEESIEALTEEEQSFEAEVISGVEEAADHPERPVRSHQDPRPAHESELPPDPDWK